jgi:hypothetical protein
MGGCNRKKRLLFSDAPCPMWDNKIKSKRRKFRSFIPLPIATWSNIMELPSSQLAVNLQAIPHSLSLISMGYWISVTVLGIQCQFDTDPISKLAWVSRYRYCSALYCLSLISMGYSVPDADVNPMSKLASVINVCSQYRWQWSHCQSMAVYISQGFHGTVLKAALPTNKNLINK